MKIKLIDDNDDELFFVVWLTDKRHLALSSADHSQRSSPSRIFYMPQAGFEPALNLSSGFDV